MLLALAFLCQSSAKDCERQAAMRDTVGEGVTPTRCLMDGAAGGAANQGLAADDGFCLVIASRSAGNFASTLH